MCHKIRQIKKKYDQAIKDCKLSVFSLSTSGSNVHPDINQLLNDCFFSFEKYHRDEFMDEYLLVLKQKNIIIYNNKKYSI